MNLFTARLSVPMHQFRNKLIQSQHSHDRNRCTDCCQYKNQTFHNKLFLKSKTFHNKTEINNIVTPCFTRIETNIDSTAVDVLSHI